MKWIDSSDILWMRNIMIYNGWRLCDSGHYQETMFPHVYYARKLINGITRIVPVKILQHIFTESGKPGILMVAGQR